jgi:hypothetical protein
MNQKLKRIEPSGFLQLHGVRSRETIKKKNMKPKQPKAEMKKTRRIENKIRESPRTERVKEKQTEKRAREE